MAALSSLASLTVTLLLRVSVVNQSFVFSLVLPTCPRDALTVDRFVPAHFSYRLALQLSSGSIEEVLRLTRLELQRCQLGEVKSKVKTRFISCLK